MENKVIGPRIAMVNGEQTALAGCNNNFCNRECLRKDTGLAYKSVHNPNNLANCKNHISPK